MNTPFKIKVKNDRLSIPISGLSACSHTCIHLYLNICMTYILQNIERHIHHTNTTVTKIKGSFLMSSITWLIEPLRIPLCWLCWEHDLNWTFLMKNSVYSESFFSIDLKYHFNQKLNSYLSPFFGLGIWFYWFCHKCNTLDRLCFLPASLPTSAMLPSPAFSKEQCHFISFPCSWDMPFSSSPQSKQWNFWRAFISGSVSCHLLDFYQAVC